MARYRRATGHSVLVGRNMDFHKDLLTNLWKQPRGAQRDLNAVAGRLTWTSTYGSVVATAFDITSTDGLNRGRPGRAHLVARRGIHLR